MVLHFDIWATGLDRVAAAYQLFDANLSVGNIPYFSWLFSHLIVVAAVHFISTFLLLLLDVVPRHIKARGDILCDILLCAGENPYFTD
jgi:hypothetical protein